MDATTSTDSIAARVARGLEWLRSDDAQRFDPDLDQIDWSEFDLTSVRQCILGQAIPAGEHYSGYDRVWNELYGDVAEYDVLDDWTRDHGFYGASYEWDALTEEWQRVLSA